MKFGLPVLSAIALAAIALSPALAGNDNDGNGNWLAEEKGTGNNGNGDGKDNNGNGDPRVRGAPGPVMGLVGAPLLAAGYGIYWLRRRRAATLVRGPDEG